MWRDGVAPAVVQKGGRILLTLFACSFVSALIESIAGVGGRTRLTDLTGVFIERPLGFLLFGFWAVWVIHKFRTVSWSLALERVLIYAPSVFLIPLINAVVAWFGLESTVPSFVNVLEAPVSLLTLGWLPRSLASPGASALFVGGALLLLLSGWRAKEPPKRFLLAAAVWLLGALVLALIPSLVSWAMVSTDVSPLNAGPNILSRTWVALSQEGYWWRSTLERFPGVLEGEAEASVRLLQAASVLLIAIFGGVGLLSRRIAFSLPQVIAWFKPVRAVSFLAMAFFGLGIGCVFGGVVFGRAIDGVAVLLFLVVLLATWGVSVWRNDLHDREGDLAQDRSDRPLIGAQLTPATYAVLGNVCGAITLIGGWLLGWPVLLPLLAFLLLQEGLDLTGIRWKERSFAGLILALSSVCVALSGIFFALRTAAVPLLPARIWLMLAIFCVFQALPKAIRWSPSLLGWLATHVRLSPRMLLPIALALGYLSVPLLSGWTVVWWIALPCAVVALLPLLGSGRWDERKIVGWQTAFIIITFLLLSVRPSS